MKVRIRRTRLLDRKTSLRDSTLCVIATEGEKTEKQYFDMFQNRRIKVEILSSEPDGRCAPHHVLERLDLFREKYDLGDGDELWLMVDVDRRRPEELSAVCQAAVQKSVGLAISNPCFELWLYLHFADAETGDTDCKAVTNRLRKRLGSYSKTNLNVSLYTAERISDAIRRAKDLHVVPAERWPAFPGTHVYKIVERLI